MALNGNLLFSIDAKNDLFFSVGKSILNVETILSDSDWLSAKSKKPDIFSQSKLSGEFVRYEFKWKHSLQKKESENQGENFGFVLGISHRKNHFLAHDLKQWNPNDEIEPIEYVSGDVLTYDQTETVPYLGMSAEFRREAWGWATEVQWSPYFWISDRDDHLLRSKLAIAHDTGFGVSLSSLLSYQASERWGYSLLMQYQNRSASGLQHQSRYQETDEGPAGPIATIDHKSHTESYGALLGIHYFFEPVSNVLKPKEELPLSTLNGAPYLSVGLGYQVFFKELYPSLGTQMEVHLDPFVLGVGYYKGFTQVDTLSKGVYTLIPVYGALQWKLGSHLKLGLGGGYLFNHHAIDPESVSLLAGLGIEHATETIAPSPIFQTILDYAPNENQSLVYRLAFSYSPIRVEAKNSLFNRQLTTSFSSITVGIQCGI